MVNLPKGVKGVNLVVLQQHLETAAAIDLELHKLLRLIQPVLKSSVVAHRLMKQRELSL